LASIQQKFSMQTRPNWAEISFSALAHNFHVVASHVSPRTTVCAVVKCDAYGHGVVRVSQTLEEAGAKFLGVTSTEEGVAVREAGVRARILVMTGFWRGEEEAVIHHELTPAIATLEHLESLERAAEALGRPTKSIAVHLKVDTGMTRLGLPMAELPDFLGRLKASRYIQLEGIFSHLASSEVMGAADAEQQIARFAEVRQTVEASGLQPAYRHLANSAAVVARPNTWDNMVRPGILLYGYELPLAGVETPVPHLNLEPVLTWKTRIIALRDVPPGRAVGYNGRFVTRAESRIAIVPVGYGDGFTRHLSNRGRVIVRDQYAPIAGNVSMDLTALDVTGVAGASIGDEVILIGKSERCFVPATEHARFADTVVYEILCGLSPRVPRIYVE